MHEPLILHLETATNICSVALSKGEEILAIRESDEERSHGSLLTVFMSEVMTEAGISPSQVNAVAISKGPGSYTGLRIGVSVAKGFAFAQNIPVIGVITLQALATAALYKPAVQKLIGELSGILLCPMIDARRMEVFSAVYNQELKEVAPVTATIVDEKSFEKLLFDKQVIFFGNGSDKIMDTIKHPHAHFIKDVIPSSRFMVKIACRQFREQAFEDTAYFEPYYLKDFIATIPRRKIL